MVTRPHFHTLTTIPILTTPELADFGVSKGGFAKPPFGGSRAEPWPPEAAPTKPQRSKNTISAAMSAGLTPETRDACPRFRG